VEQPLETVIPANDEQAPAQPYAANTYTEPVATVPRTLLNYVIIGAVFFIVGLIVGLFGNDYLAGRNVAENRALIAQVTEAISAAGGQAAAAESGPRLDPTQRYTIDTAGNPAIGPEDAPVVIVEFGDFRCGFCKRFQDETLAPLLAQYEGQVRLVYRDYPILGQSSLDAAVAAECADDQGQFWEFHDLLFADQANLTRAGFIVKAQALGMDVETFTSCYDNQQHREEIAADYQAGAELGVGGTPTFFINGIPIIGAQSLEVFSRVIDEELAQAASSAS
jgi:protein-disulfide isomerase